MNNLFWLTHYFYHSLTFSSWTTYSDWHITFTIPLPFLHEQPILTDTLLLPFHYLFFMSNLFWLTCYFYHSLTFSSWITYSDWHVTFTILLPFLQEQPILTDTLLLPFSYLFFNNNLFWLTCYFYHSLTFSSITTYSDWHVTFTILLPFLQEQHILTDTLLLPFSYLFFNNNLFWLTRYFYHSLTFSSRTTYSDWHVTFTILLHFLQ